MGIDWHAARFLIAVRSTGIAFDRTATIGRQNLYITPYEIRDLFHEFGMLLPENNVAALHSEFADPLITALGAKACTSIDASPYEGASVVHDMNCPIPDRLRDSFDVVVDAGTLEHVFNFPTAIKNCMEMVRVGGYLLLHTPANNFFGHGFYQFSPELFYRVLSPENGYTVLRMIAHEAYAHSQWYEVADPAQAGQRVELIGPRQRVLLLIQAKHTHAAKVLATPPQQSDYVAAWSGTRSNANSVVGKPIVQRQPSALRRLAWKALRLGGFADTSTLLEKRHWLQNRRLGLRAQPDVFRPVER